MMILGPTAGVGRLPFHAFQKKRQTAGSTKPQARTGQANYAPTTASMVTPGGKDCLGGL